MPPPPVPLLLPLEDELLELLDELLLDFEELDELLLELDELDELLLELLLELDELLFLLFIVKIPDIVGVFL